MCGWSVSAFLIILISDMLFSPYSCLFQLRSCQITLSLFDLSLCHNCVRFLDPVYLNLLSSESFCSKGIINLIASHILSLYNLSGSAQASTSSAMTTMIMCIISGKLEDILPL
ncbi:hypothetical protein RND81_09G229800 [Saponaria officinalis]|uniref:Secreted protein n=1 Tax=Saponaria officinalis TaxID=3572 RepID=A0AAW1IPS4_SAPOF